MNTTVFASIERCQPSQSIAELSAIQERLPLLTGKRVVIVEDEGLTQAQLRKICMVSGLCVVGAASTAQEGVEAVLRERPDMVLMDIRMPGEMNGLDAAELILANFAVCMVMLTAYVDAEYRERARRIGASGYVVKPVSRDSLLPQLIAAYERFEQVKRERPANT